jgi:HPt (histidine-containing phosphotransfer) domain-containing protein
MGVESKYRQLQRKYRLPSFEQLDKEFEISCIEQERFLLREIRKKLDEKIDDICKTLEEVLQPDTNLSGIYESRVFSDEEKKRVFDLYRRLMRLHRQGFELLVKSDDKSDADFVRSVSAEWEKLKKELSQVARKLQESWEKEMEENEKLGYFG